MLLFTLTGTMLHMHVVDYVFYRVKIIYSIKNMFHHLCRLYISCHTCYAIHVSCCTCMMLRVCTFARMPVLLQLLLMMMPRVCVKGGGVSCRKPTMYTYDVTHVFDVALMYDVPRVCHAASFGMLIPTPQMSKLCSKLAAAAATIPADGGTTLGMAVIGGSFSCGRTDHVYMCSEEDAAMSDAASAANGRDSRSRHHAHREHSHHSSCNATTVGGRCCEHVNVTSWFDELVGVMRQSLDAQGVRGDGRDDPSTGAHVLALVVGTSRLSWRRPWPAYLH